MKLFLHFVALIFAFTSIRGIAGINYSHPKDSVSELPEINWSKIIKHTNLLLAEADHSNNTTEQTPADVATDEPNTHNDSTDLFWVIIIIVGGIGITIAITYFTLKNMYK